MRESGDLTHIVRTTRNCALPLICATFIVAIATCVVAMVVSPLNSSRDFENDFQLDRRAKRKTCNAVDEAARVSLFAEDILQ